MNILEHELIQNCLKKGDEYTNKDKSNFKEWRKGKITTEKCIESFIENNSVSKARASQLEARAFEEWLLSIGW